MRMRLWTLVVGILAFTGISLADGPQDNLADKVRPVPPPGEPIPPMIQAELQKSVDEIAAEIEQTKRALAKNPKMLALLPDAQVLHRGVEVALKHNEFYSPKEFDVAKKHLALAKERLEQLKQGKPTWTTATGPVVRGYVSKIDGSIQPYGLVVPPTYSPNAPHEYRLDFWCHGRGEKLTELAFNEQRRTSLGEFTPPNAFVLHLYGRYCNANKFAGEVDLLEAYAAVKANYPIDENRLVIRGFSMGGAACWQFAAHYPGMFVAAAPGAGFSETPEFLNVFQNEDARGPWYQEKLWRMYNATDYALNFANLPTVAYSGEKDKQIQAANAMARAMSAAGLHLTHLIGPNTGHSYHPATKAELNRRIDAIVARGKDICPTTVRFTTWTLRYNQSHWVKIDGLAEHWERGVVEATLKLPNSVSVRTQGITGLTLEMAPGTCPFDPTGKVTVTLDGQPIPGAPVGSDRSWRSTFHKVGDAWQAGPPTEDGKPRKITGLQGPIDDAFWDRFIIVRPTGKAMHPATAEWTKSEMDRAISHWRKQFRGDAIVKNDTEITTDDIASANLVLWGDPSSNSIIGKVLPNLPLKWTTESVTMGTQSLPANSHQPILIYPNPLNPRKYVVLNSGITFREYDYLNNARQVPKLPDYAIVDLSQKPNSRSPGKIVQAGFFNERWEWVKPMEPGMPK
ncbi:prolyl oligopeptidase family serine peptidase [Tuwongella immobilis]|uniref:Peptidase S9 prolyl oligopeptidase catalytic domain-containing protein n=1 Tax=Tuwongella immobilis TaxID=692036 RepID=A0A6C2YMQ7_9BACT|nr:prolyl oligopeptidase family serine peptidase [Tuwongella immobilis]VIP02878.1 prolyl oligopeptidase family protein : Uncharacterized protein OS=Planctomyces maris DSM 8797 GN=PM8797T_05200 PE=4 SV=1: Peptidase_S9 [Tuwongella immobilis]VTS02722.1 prolyl oligopeptidase family protein : Uncharacterized protein OS=Planctomyces maris DSM 8797 GN=PM8797T_05200 PE=4 SV=1: Peptidase_S9 [Tuwongella immobilis]